MDTLYTILYFLVAVALLIAIHEFGHFWVARKCGVKVLKFSIGFGKKILSFQKHPDSTEYLLCAIPLGGYVKMVDEREGKVKSEDLPYAFNRQPLASRAAIVAAGPIFNLLLAIILFWIVAIAGEVGIRPIVGTVDSETLAGQAGFTEGDEIVAINDKKAPTWTEAINLIISAAIEREADIKVLVDSDDIEKTLFLEISDADIESPEILYKKLGLTPWSPTIQPILGEIIEESSAERAGLIEGDLILSADGIAIEDWMDWVEYVKERPETLIELDVERDGLPFTVSIVPDKIENEEGKFIGRIGAAVKVPEQLINELRVEYSFPPTEALLVAIEKTWIYSSTTLKMMGKMLLGQVSTKNLSGPISIAQFAGQSAERGVIPFIKFLGLVSVSLGVLNLLPIPVLDGGHLMFFLVEAIKGSPVSEKAQIYFQQVGIMLLMSLMLFAFFLDMERVLW